MGLILGKITEAYMMVLQGLGWFVLSAGISLLKFNNRNTRTRCAIYSKYKCSNLNVFFVDFEHTSHLVLVFVLLILDM